MTLETLEPREVFRYFREISAIPRPSYHEKAISDYLAAFAEERGLSYVQDDLYNVIIIREASPGCEQAAPLILQGHMDMVCEKEPDCTKDMLTEAPELVLEGDLLSAKGTTLGGDDGVAVACMLALLDDDALPHPRLECIFTVSEEVGMEGADGLDVSLLQGRRLINLDSEEEGILLASCAGGGRIDIMLPLERTPTHGTPLAVSVTGLTGGHSGGEIHRGRANAPLLLARLLTQVLQAGVRFALVSIDGGEKDNAIPRSARAVVCAEDAQAFAQTVERLAADAAGEFRTSDPNLRISVEPPGKDASGGEGLVMRPLSDACTTRVLGLLSALPNGVVRMSDPIPGLVETSLNLGILQTRAQELSASYAPRSSVTSAFDALASRMRIIAESFGAEFALRSRYPAWEYRAESVLRPLLCDTWKELTGKEMKIEAIHAGLECGILAGKLPGLDAVSIGPDLWDVHTPQERLSVSSTARTWQFLCRVVEKLSAAQS